MDEPQTSTTPTIPPGPGEGDWLVTPWGQIVELGGLATGPCDCGLCPDEDDED